jgi:uncharacterized protein YjbI with pentapeptide repeats
MPSVSNRKRFVWRGVGAVTVIAIAVLVDLQAWRWSWVRSVAAVVGQHLALFLGGLIVVVLVAETLFRRRFSAIAPAGDRAGTARWPWLLADRGLVVVAGVLTAIGALALLVMLDVAGGVPPGAERAKLTIEAIKYGLGSVAAGGAAAALLLAVRRQRHAEQVHDHTVDDAAERRVTDLYTKAVEQLGHADAAVRLGGLYALERVAQNNPRQRQTIVNVLCAYLRMPYTPPPAADTTPAVTGPVTDLPLPRTATTWDGGRDPYQELQVRLTAQRILSTHLTLPPEVTAADEIGTVTASADQPFWPDIDLDLTGATLIDWTLDRASLRNATFTSATFTGTSPAWFNKAIFTGNAWFYEATFTSDAWFGEATFTGNAWFEKATFTRGARFGKATFTGDAEFDEATFTGDAWFGGATFTGGARFGKATFTGAAWFKEATFTGDAWFNEATFTGGARFGKATFTDGAQFSEATFTGTAEFSEATFTGTAWFDEATFTGTARFDKVAFTSDARFDKATFRRSPDLRSASVVLGPDRNDVWPMGWRLMSGPNGGRLVRENISGTAPSSGTTGPGTSSG